ncbi:hypothetical protein D030_2815B, partial [Vibrio parahaemolyticus AQ3810]
QRLQTIVARFKQTMFIQNPHVLHTLVKNGL